MRFEFCGTTEQRQQAIRECIENTLAHGPTYDLVDLCKDNMYALQYLAIIATKNYETLQHIKNIL